MIDRCLTTGFAWRVTEENLVRYLHSSQLEVNFFVYLKDKTTVIHDQKLIQLEN